MAEDSPPQLDVEPLVEAAVAHHRAGQLSEAERLYAAALQTCPGHWRASHNLGSLLLARKAPDRALPLLRYAYEADRDGPVAWNTYGQALVAAGEFEIAEALIRACAARPRAAELELRLRQAWGLALIEQEALADAEPQLERALELAPDDADAHADLGLLRLHQGRAEEAVVRLERSLALRPDQVGPLLNLGSALKAAGRMPDAEARYRQALALAPGDGAAIRNLVILLNDLERGVEATALAEQALAGDPAAYGPLLRLVQGDVLRGRGEYAGALDSYQQAMAGGADAYEILPKVAQALAGLGRFDEALAAFDRAVALRPTAPNARYLRAQLRLLLCDFAGGWRDYETRWDTDVFLAKSAGKAGPKVRARLRPETTAADLAGRRVLVAAEQGIGDEVMFASLLPDLARTAATVSLVCEPRLVRLFSASFPQITVTAPGAPVDLAAFDEVLALGGLPRLWRNRLEDFPGTPFLAPRPEARARWAERLGERRARLRIGVSWRGGTAATRAGERSLPLAELAPVLDLPDCEFVSLQYGDPRDEVAAFNAGRPNPVRVFPPAELDDFEDLAGLVQNLDAVVSVQTALVHLAGAIGANCLTLVPHNPEWRYTADCDVMPWYRSVRLFRQPEPGAWAPVLRRVADEVRKLGR